MMIVITGLVPVIHPSCGADRISWMAGPSPAMTIVDGVIISTLIRWLYPVKPGHAVTCR